MKIVSIDGSWFFNGGDSPDDTHSPIVPWFNGVLNQGLPENKYVCSTGDDPNDFIVLNMLGAGFEDNFTIRIVKMPDSQKEPYIILYKISDEALAKKFAEWLVTFHPADRVSLYNVSFLPPSLIEKVIEIYK